MDNEHLMRQALRIVLDTSPATEWIGEAANGLEAIEFCRHETPDIILMDMQMPRMNGVEATAIITAKYPTIGVLAITSFSSEEFLVPALRAGAAGYLVKDAEPAELLAAIGSVHEGNAALSQSVSRDLVETIRNSTGALGHGNSPQPPVPLSQRELDVVKSLAKGRNNSEIAKELQITEATVKAHLGRIMAKFDVRDRVQTLIRATQYGLVELNMD
ncbi:DNA-binding NarL/FixJ family response regulator [Paeniglutamicibacter cryotolerans]|uniref:DNA-binding NarL/FixJ family response regulator n=1 Tax=Paeniglutamicibacter cryotolerans TaxID=670079 RepID=A0A839QHI4_9MICC|nr:DNA-binding NarL/FixJ family response regulator [Paeniglutamicibacter cryotolerans]